MHLPMAISIQLTSSLHSNSRNLEDDEIQVASADVQRSHAQLCEPSDWSADGQ